VILRFFSALQCQKTWCRATMTEDRMCVLAMFHVHCNDTVWQVNPQALVARTTPLFSNFLFTNLFSIKFLYFFIISSLFPYFNLFVSIFIQSYVNIKLHVSTLLDYNNTQGMQLGRFKNRTPARFEYIYCTLFPLCHSN
jgi:hypothetical protein